MASLRQACDEEPGFSDTDGGVDVRPAFGDTDACHLPLQLTRSLTDAGHVTVNFTKRLHKPASQRQPLAVLYSSFDIQRGAECSASSSE